MSETIPNLWPDDIKVDVLPPLVILRAQASQVRQLTKGVLLGEVTSTDSSDGLVTHRLDLIAPALNNRRVRILSATHRESFYPVVIEAECYRPKAQLAHGASILAAISSLTERTWPDTSDWRPVAAGQSELIKSVGEVLKSKEVRAVIDSLLALSNEKTQPAEEPAA